MSSGASLGSQEASYCHPTSGVHPAARLRRSLSTPEAPKAPKAPKAIEAPEAPEAPEAIDAPEAPDTPETPEAIDAASSRQTPAVGNSILTIH